MKISKINLSIVICITMIFGQLCLFPFASKADSYNQEIVFEEGDKLALEIGENETLTISGVNYDSDSIVWKSGNNNVVTVKNGVLDAVGIGRTYITAEVFVNDHKATLANASKKAIAKCVVTVGSNLLRIATPAVPYDVSENWGFTISNNKVTITKYKGVSPNIVIPNEIEGKPVTELGDYLFQGKAVTDVIMPDSIEKIGEGVFEDCKKLTKVILSDSLKELPAFTFDGCSKLKTINLPEALEVLNTSILSNIVMNEVHIPQNVREITINRNPKSISSYSVDPNNKYFSSLNGMLVSKDKSTLYLYPLGGIQENDIIKLPNNIKVIKDYSVIESMSGKGNVFLSKNISDIEGLSVNRKNYARNIWVETSSRAYDILKINSYPMNCATEDAFDKIMSSDFKLLYDYVTDNNTLIVEDYLGNSDSVVVPESIGSMKITKMTGDLFDNRKVTSVSLPQTLENFVYLDGSYGIKENNKGIIPNDSIRKIINNSQINIPIRNDEYPFRRGMIRWFNQEYSGGLELTTIPSNSTAYRHYIITYTNYRTPPTSSGPGGNTSYGDYGYNEEYTLKIAPSVSGYTFLGWEMNHSVGDDLNKVVYISKIPKGTNKDIDVTADYSRNSSSSGTGSSGGHGGSGNSSPKGVVPSDSTSTQNKNVPGIWKQDERGWWLQKPDGSYPKLEWVMNKNKWYHFDKNGYMQSGWIEVKKIKYFLNPSGVMVSNDWSIQNGKWYYFNDSGAMQTGWVNWKDKWYYMNADGSMSTNIKTPDGYAVNDKGELVQ